MGDGCPMGGIINRDGGQRHYCPWWCPRAAVARLYWGPGSNHHTAKSFSLGVIPITEIRAYTRRTTHATLRAQSNPPVIALYPHNAKWFWVVLAPRSVFVLGLSHVHKVLQLCLFHWWSFFYVLSTGYYIGGHYPYMHMADVVSISCPKMQHNTVTHVGGVILCKCMCASFVHVLRWGRCLTIREFVGAEIRYLVSKAVEAEDPSHRRCGKGGRAANHVLPQLHCTMERPLSNA